MYELKNKCGVKSVFMNFIIEILFLKKSSQVVLIME